MLRARRCDRARVGAGHAAAGDRRRPDGPADRARRRSRAGADVDGRRAAAPSAARWRRRSALRGVEPDDARRRTPTVVMLATGARRGVGARARGGRPRRRDPALRPRRRRASGATFDVHDLFFRELEIQASYSAGPRDTRAALDADRRRRGRAPSGSITHRFPLEDDGRGARRRAQPRGHQGDRHRREGRAAARRPATCGSRTCADPVARPGRGRAGDRRGAELRHRRQERRARASLDRRAIRRGSGHEFAGVVAAVGRGRRGVARRRRRVLRATRAPCGALPRSAARGRESLCEDLLYLLGGFAEQLLVPERVVRREPAPAAGRASRSRSRRWPSRWPAPCTRSTPSTLGPRPRRDPRRRLARADAVRARRDGRRAADRARPAPRAARGGASASAPAPTVVAERGAADVAAVRELTGGGADLVDRGRRAPGVLGARGRDGRARRHREPVRRLRAATRTFTRPDRARALRGGHAPGTYHHAPRYLARALDVLAAASTRGRSCAAPTSGSTSCPTRSPRPHRRNTRCRRGLTRNSEPGCVCAAWSDSPVYPLLIGAGGCRPAACSAQLCCGRPRRRARSRPPFSSLRRRDGLRRSSRLEYADQRGPLHQRDEPQRRRWSPTPSPPARQVVAPYQVGRFFNGGASDIGYARSTDGGASWDVSSFLPGLTFNADRSPTRTARSSGSATRASRSTPDTAPG